ncbi:MAG: hypothetical protein KC493_16995 [Bacteriovoracaceae bacterium]|nr:hypothetical protein [Bacteriovoracaceae bacterium]
MNILFKLCRAYNIPEFDFDKVKVNESLKVKSRCFLNSDLKFSFKKSVEGCGALNDLWNKETLNHTERLVLLSIACNTFDGPEMLLERWPSSKTKYHINYAIQNKTKPRSCENLQKESICETYFHPLYDDHCFDAYSNSKPSPIRLGRCRGSNDC